VKISYRITSIAVVLVVVGMIVVPESLMVRPPASTTVLGDGGISFNPCFAMSEHAGWLIRLSALVWIGTFLPLFVQGLRKRTMPRWVAVVSAIAFGLSLHNQLWRVQPCGSNVSIGLFALWVVVVGMMCLHHVIQRPVWTRPNNRPKDAVDELDGD
jgi:hypothetical protein